MDAIGTSIPVITTPAPSLPAAPQAVAIANASLPGNAPDTITIDLQNVEQRRFEAIQKASADPGNVYVVSDKSFTIFKDATGQYITRFTSLRDGKVTYVPEPQLLKMSNPFDPSVLKVQA